VAAQMCEVSDLGELEEMVRPLIKLRGEIHAEFLRTLYKKYPDLESYSKSMYSMSHSSSQDFICDSKSALNIDGLSDKQVSRVDDQLVDLINSRWQKTAFIVGTAMTRLGEEFKGIPDVYYVSRLSRIFDAGELEVNGDLRRMRMSEVRIASPDNQRPET